MSNSIMEKQAEASVELRLPIEVASFFSKHPILAVEALQMSMNRMSDGVPETSILQQADATINGPRQADYGDKLTNFSQISMLWQGMLAHKLLPDSRITPEDVALLMMLVKMARLAKSPDHYDSVLDIAGYAGCYDHIQRDRAANKKLKGALRDARAAE